MQEKKNNYRTDLTIEFCNGKHPGNPRQNYWKAFSIDLGHLHVRVRRGKNEIASFVNSPFFIPDSVHTFLGSAKQ